jgi:hypothetical protein
MTGIATQICRTMIAALSNSEMSSESHPIISQFMMINTIIDPIIYFKQCNSYFFEPFHNGWHFTTVNNQPLSAMGLLWVPLVISNQY